jgi:hypothetical protein
MHTLRLTAADITRHMFLGGFKPMDKNDYMAYADAELGSLIADIPVGKYIYQVLFTPSEGTFEINFFDENCEPYAWKMDVLTGETIQL